MIKADKNIKGSKVAIFGVTFKENTPDVRNTKVVDVIKELEEYGVEVMVVDPVADKEDLWNAYELKLSEMEDVRGVDAVIFAVPHTEFENIQLNDLKEMFSSEGNNKLKGISEAAATIEAIEEESYVLIDIKGMFDRKETEEAGFEYWR